MTNPGLTDPTDQIAALREALAKCPICGSQPRRSARKGSGGVVCYAGSHRLQSLAETQPEADRIWNDMAADWAARNTRDGQADLALRVVEAIAEVEHIATAIDRNGLNSRSAQLRDAARVFRAALALPHPVGDRESIARELVVAVEDFINEPQRSSRNVEPTEVRDYRHDLYRVWSPLRDAIIALSPTAAAPEGFVMLPREPTEAMVNAYFERCRERGFRAHITATAAWSAMLSATPTPENKS